MKYFKIKLNTVIYLKKKKKFIIKLKELALLYKILRVNFKVVNLR